MNVQKDKRDRRKYFSEYHKKWYQLKKAGLPTRTTPKLELTNEERRLRKNLRNRKSQAKRINNRRLALSKKYGELCYICGENSVAKHFRVQLHRKDGAPHKKWFHMTNAQFDEVINGDEYILICYWCHKHLHWCMKYLGLVWEEINSRLVR